MPAGRRHFKAREVETRRHGTADQSERAQAAGALPGGFGHHDLRPLACRQIEDLRDDPEFDAQLEQLEACLRLAPLTAFRAEAGR